MYLYMESNENTGNNETNKQKINEINFLTNVKSEKKWLVLDVDDCLYNKTYKTKKGGIISNISFGDAFIPIHTKIIESYLGIINEKMNLNFDSKTLVDYSKKLNGGSNSIIGLIILLEKLNIHFSMSKYHNTMFKHFKYDKIKENLNINNLIKKAHDCEMKVAIFSNGSYPHIMKCLHQLRVDISLLDHISCLEFTSKQVINEQKPSMFSYINFQNEILAKPENIYFFDDSYNNCKTANNLGWNTILVNDDNNKKDVLIYNTNVNNYNDTKKVNNRNHKKAKKKTGIFNLKNGDKKYIHCISNINEAEDLVQYM